MTRKRRTAAARSLRRRSGPAETRLWAVVSGGRVDGLKFRRQHAVGRFYVDFACERLRLIIELDGGVHRMDEVAADDAFRQAELEALGWTVMRFENDTTLAENWRIVEAIRKHSRAIAVTADHEERDG